MTQPYETSAIDTATMNDLVKRVAELEERLQEHTGDAQGSAGQFYPHPVQIIDTAEYSGGVARIDNHGIQIATSGVFTPAIWGVNQLVGVPSGENTYIKLQLSADPSGASFDFINQTTGGITSEVNASTSNVTGIAQAKHEVYGSYQLGILHNGSTTAYGWCDLPFWFIDQAGDPTTTLSDGMAWYNGTLKRLRIRSNGITGNLGIEIQSASAAAVATNGTITTAGVSVARVAPAGAVTGVILAVGTTGGQVCTVVNESVAANTVTFAASGTSNVADGTSSVIAGLNARRFVWDSGTSLWYPCK